MRKLALATAAMIAGTSIGTVGWQVGLAAVPQADTLVVCQRVGADVRSPAANGTCPSGYTKVEITETLPTTPPPPQDPVIAYHDRGSFDGGDLPDDEHTVSLSLPAGTYTISATGKLSSLSGLASSECTLVSGAELLDRVTLSIDGTTYDDSAMSATLDTPVPAAVHVDCGDPGDDGSGTTVISWALTATRVNGLVQP